jgi:hypothetical protein
MPDGPIEGPKIHLTSGNRGFSLLTDRKQSNSCRCSARMNAWQHFFPHRGTVGCPAIGRTETCSSWSHSDSTDRRTDLALHSSWQAGAAMVLVSRTRPAFIWCRWFSGRLRIERRHRVFWIAKIWRQVWAAGISLEARILDDRIVELANHRRKQRQGPAVVLSRIRARGGLRKA